MVQLSSSCSSGLRRASLPTLALATLLALAACSGDDEGGGAGGPRGPGGPGGRAVPVTTAEVGRGAISARATYVAELQASADVELASEVSGRVEAVRVDLGDAVEAGQVLAVIDPRTYSQALHEAYAALKVAQAEAEKARVEADAAQRDYERKRSLLDRDLLSRGEWDVVESRQRNAQSSLGLSEASVAQARARVARARLDTERTEVTAPFDGRVAAREVDPGALVSPGTALFRLTAVDPLVLRFAAPERDVLRLAPGQDVAIHVDAAPGETFDGEVARVSPVVDPDTRTTPVEVVLENPGGLKPGMFARVEVTLADRAGSLLVPSRAVVRRQMPGSDAVREGVFVVADGTAAFRPVELGVRNRERVEVLEGLSEGQTVITAGHADLKDGAQVKVVEAVVGAEAAAGAPSAGARGS